MQLDFELFYSSIFLSFEDQEYKELQDIIRELLIKSKQHQVEFYTKRLDNPYRTEYINLISELPYLDLIKEKGEQIIQSVKDFIEELGFEVISTDLDSLIVDNEVNVSDVRKFILDTYGKEFHIEVS